ncbi:SMI1/KNR4 family protein [Criblamydia sequanensis]|uniref:Cell wall assembly regulator protein n=1 Tax=Candidatus Criblamydia sequanensis CRIB-18 TaxID=1437425 RepID=A0A090D3D1_9BACT|nr:SMI1/KNR4 family protein [Criblamydia sequanensis]CDR35173.1 Cell wall assembly regulator protein [Criblamydia sequanensis CRIB-18]
MTLDAAYQSFAEKFYIDSNKLTPYPLEEIQKAETALEFQFPKDYRDFLLQVGPQAIYRIDSEKLDEEDFDEVDCLCYMTDLLLLDQVIEYHDTISDELIPFAGDGNGNKLCFSKELQGIFFWDHETDEVIFIKDSFKEVVQKVLEFPTTPLPCEEDPEEFASDDFDVYTLKVTNLGPNKMEVLMALRRITGWSLEETKERIARLPCSVISKGKLWLSDYSDYLENLGASIILVKDNG